MKFRRIVAASTSLSLIGSWCLASAVGGHPTPPSPPPCTADGACLPAQPWGLTKPRWRQWPGTPSGELATPTPAADPLGPIVQPPPIDEDREAPPQIEAIEPEADTSSGASGIELPTLPEFDTPATEEGRTAPPPAGPPAGPGKPGIGVPGPLDLPPLPFGDPLPSLTPSTQIQQSRVMPVAPQPTRAASASRDNAPPAMPFALQQAVGNSVLQASFAPTQCEPVPYKHVPREPVQHESAIDRSVAPAVATSPVGSNAPPALPAIFYQNN